MQVSLKHLLKLVTPPFIPALVRWGFTLPARGRLFDGNDDIFLDLISSAKTYAEYGCGASTIWTANETALEITSVDTSLQWLEHVQEKISKPDRIKTVYVDLGDLGEWGRPVSYAQRQKFIDYAEAPWNDGQSYDLVLVDGRFRVACFLTTLLRARSGTKVIFDDYIGRSHFQVAEEFAQSFRKNARQIAFTVPEQIDREMIEKERDKFLYVME